jgi:hypothetical protein
MLQTPFGAVEILLDGKALPYNAEAVPLDNRCPDLPGRFGITVHISPDGLPHTLSCVLSDLPAYAESDMESGERLELISFYADGVKLSVGTEAEEGFFPNGYYDYDCAHLDHGMAYLILPQTKTESFTFGIAWIDGVPDPDDINNPRDVQTWFGADPTLF